MIDFKAGQKVWSMSYGEGRIVSIDEDDPDYPIYVEFDNDRTADYTIDGRYSKYEQRTLFFKEIPIPEYALVPPVEEIILNTGDILVFHDGTLGYVETYSGSIEKTFSWHDKVPQSLDEAFGPTSSFKKSIKKVIGNING